MTELFKLTLRTSNVDAARDFYAKVLGEASSLDIVQLHEQAVARGAKPHWLGFIQVDDVDALTAKFVERGAAVLSPKWVNPLGLEAAVLRDPGGAIVALGKPPPNFASHGPAVAFRVLNTNDVETAKKNYGDLFGWTFKPAEKIETFDQIHPFLAAGGTEASGAFVGIEGRSHVHPHWLFAMRVPELDAAIAAVKSGGGVVLPPFVLPSGERVAVCDDAQGAAFALHAPK
ncbi:MAG: hypothetical protein QM817_21040 [Archangium sp.]